MMDTQQHVTNQKVGIMGGTFDPIHYGHLILAEYVATDVKLDKVIFMPSGTPYLKSHVTEKKHRLEMTKRGIAGNDKFIVSTMELDRVGNTYTVDTMATLKQSHPNTRFYFIMGADSLFDLEKWKNSEQLFKICDFAVTNRGGTYSKTDLQTQIQTLNQKYASQISLVSIPDIQISSTEIRKRVRNNQSIKYLLPGNVEAYILEQGLYK